MLTQNVQRSFVERMREEFKQDLSRLSQSAQHINRYSWSLHIKQTHCDNKVINKYISVQNSGTSINDGLQIW